MSQFILMIEGVNSKQMEGILRLEKESDGHLKFVPVEAIPGNEATRVAVEREIAAGEGARTEIYKGVRVEWDDFGVASARQLLDLFSLSTQNLDWDSPSAHLA